MKTTKTENIMKTQTKHTPGPWHVQRHDAGDSRRITITGRSGMVAVADVDWNSPIENDANAALIASAPELLMALRNLQKAVTNAPDIRVGEFSALVADAIAKAEGGEE
jgi:hypothetical protein